MPAKGTSASRAGTGQHADKPSGRFAYDGLDRVMHEKARLGILASLAANDGGLLFNDLKQLCSLTDGNLSRHLAVLNDAGLVEIWKGTSGRTAKAARPQTMYRLTKRGKKRFADYLSELERVIADAHRDAEQSVGSPIRRGGGSQGWSTG